MKTFKICVSGDTLNQINKAEEDHKNIFKVFEDIEGKKYLMAHSNSGYIFADDKIGRTSEQLYQTLINKGLIEDGEEITVLCCHGSLVSQCNNISIANDEDAPLFIHRRSLKNGDGLLVVFTKTNFMNKAKAAAYAMF